MIESFPAPRPCPHGRMSLGLVGSSPRARSQGPCTCWKRSAFFTARFVCDDGRSRTAASGYFLASGDTELRFSRRKAERGKRWWVSGGGEPKQVRARPCQPFMSQLSGPKRRPRNPRASPHRNPCRIPNTEQIQRPFLPLRFQAVTTDQRAETPSCSAAFSLSVSSSKVSLNHLLNARATRRKSA
jgi:hypothetical protein